MKDTFENFLPTPKDRIRWVAYANGVTPERASRATVNPKRKSKLRTQLIHAKRAATRKAWDETHEAPDLTPRVNLIPSRRPRPVALPVTTEQAPAPAEKPFAMKFVNPKARRPSNRQVNLLRARMAMLAGLGAAALPQKKES